MYYYFWIGIRVLIIIILILSHDHMVSKRTRFGRYSFFKGFEIKHRILSNSLSVLAERC